MWVCDGVGVRITLGWKAPCSEPKGPVGGMTGGRPDMAGG